MEKYTVRLAVDGRVDVEVKAESSEEAARKAPAADFKWDDVELVDLKPVNVTDERGNMRDC